MKTWIAIIGLIVLVVVVYGNILGNRFTNWDDEHLIVKNKAIRTLDILFIIKNFHISYPPMTVISHCCDYLFWRLNPVGYHITDLIIYVLITLAFFCLCNALIGSSGAAFAAATLFAVHPLHVESVAWLSSRKDGMGMLFYLLSFLAYLRSRGEKGCGFLWLSAFFYLCAVWSKPLMITLPIALILYDILLADRRGATGKILLNKLPYAAPLLLTGLATAFLDPHKELHFSYHGGSIYNTFLAMSVVLGDYLRMLVLPVNLCSLYLVEIPPLLTEIPCLLSLAAIATVLVAAMAAARRAALFPFCVFWGAASLIPVLQIIPISVIKADRYLYLPTAALCLLCAGVFNSSTRPLRFRGGLLALGTIITLLAILSIVRNTVWRDSSTLWEAVIARNPSSADAYNNLGIVYLQRGRYEEAEEILTHAVSLRPDFASAHNNLGNVYRVTRRYDRALEEFDKAMGLTKDAVYSANVYIGIGMVYEARREYEKALEAYEHAMRLNPVYLDDSLLRARITACRSQRDRANS